ncbi:hypothetical protein MF672_045795 [Actinomadura sp. ATCC 31491]|uniref:DUF4265 domain-containing protein n=1 Tax=Actinomadura luzonensis TaxID=2805427 RepID=A0ABT0GAF9_9ACTN|nr:hypothetical protein [Actinomadura luzonensis]MCK2221068.1 hypothetical protein [Actinomadura luzonensis]
MIDYYRDLMRRYGWLEHGLRWIVVQPLDEELTRDDLLWRLNGGRDPERRVVPHPVEASANEDGALVFVVEGDGAWGFLDFTGSTVPDELLAKLSAGARVWCTVWTFNRHDSLCYAAGGRVRARMSEFAFADHVRQEGEVVILDDPFP